MKFILAFIILSQLTYAWSCEVEVPPHLLMTASSIRDWPFPQQGCLPEQLREVTSLFVDQDGEIPVSRLVAALDKSIRLVTTSKSIKVDNTSALIRRSFAEVSDAEISVVSPFQGGIVAIEAQSEFVMHCHPCQFNGEEVLRLNVKSFSKGETNYSFQAKFTRFVDAFRLRQPIPAFSENLTTEHFEKVRVPLAIYGQYLKDLTGIAHYKTNKPLRRGDILRSSDLTPKMLVRAGDRVEIIFENQLVRVKAQALSRQNGGVGESVEVWNQANGKKYRGTVIDHNRVMVVL